MTVTLEMLSREKLYQEKGEGPTVVPPGQERTIFDKTGPGVVKTFFMAIGGEVINSLDGRIRVYYDGSSTPSMDIDIATLFATHWQGLGVHTTPHMSAQVAQAPHYDHGILISFPMPFGDRIKITYYNSANPGHDGYIYWQIAYNLSEVDEWDGMRLRCWGKRYRDQLQSRSAGATTTFCDINDGRPGSVVWMSLVGGVDASGSNKLSWMERNIDFYIDGETDASIKSSGTEDFFDSAWYFMNGKKDVGLSHNSYVATDKPSVQPNCVGMAIDFLSKWGGVPFENRCVMKSPPEPACNASDKFVYAILFYN